MTVVDLYTIQIIREPEASPFMVSTYNTNKMMEATEEDLTDLLPEGYRARIRRWDHPDPDEPTQEEDDE